MDFETTREPIGMDRAVFCGSSEQPIDLDISLPDYCPDISRILKCQAVPQVTSRSLVGDRLTVEGSTIIRIFYADEEGKLRCCELNSAFSSDFNLRTVPEMPAIFTDIRVDFMNCRAVTKRRVDIHCAFTVTARVWARQTVELLERASGAGIRIRTAVAQTCTHIGTVQQPISISEEFAVEHDRPAPETILCFAANGWITDQKQVVDKMMLKGTIRLHVLYSTDVQTGRTDTVEYTVPFSSIVDMEGLDADCDCDARLELLSTQVRLQPSDGGDPAAFEAEIRGAVCVTASRAKTVELVTDAYSTECELQLEPETVSLPVRVEPLQRAITAKGSVDCGGAAQILDVWAEPRSVSGQYKDGALEITGRICAAVLFCNAEEQADYREALLDYSDRIPWDAAEAEWDLQTRVERIAYRPDGGGSIELKADLTVSSSAHAQQKYTVLHQLTPDPQRPKEKDSSCAMILYYADAGEQLWDIARRYNTTEQAIRQENDLTGDVVEQNGMLMIPIV